MACVCLCVGAVNLKLSRFDDAFDGYKEAWELLKSSVAGSHRAFDSDKVRAHYGCVFGAHMPCVVTLFIV